MYYLLKMNSSLCSTFPHLFSSDANPIRGTINYSSSVFITITCLWRTTSHWAICIKKIKSFLVQLNGWKIIWTSNMIRQINLFLVHRCSDRYWLLITAVTYYMLDSSSEWTCNLAFVFTSSVFTFMWSDLISWNLLSLIRCLIRWPLSTWNLCFLFSFIDQRAYREPAAALPDTYPVWSPSTDWSWR